MSTKTGRDGALARWKRACQRGYTAIEVLVSLSIVIVGAAGVISMQRATIQGDVDARRMDMANAIARQWTERLRTDAMLWTLPAAINPNSNFSQAALLQNVAIPANAQWFIPDQRLPAPTNWSPGMDALGSDVPLTDLGDDKNRYALFCTHVRLTWLIQDQLMRADVRVFWPRGLSVAPEDHFCSNTPNTAIETMTDSYHFVYATTAIRRNAIQ